MKLYRTKIHFLFFFLCFCFFVCVGQQRGLKVAVVTTLSSKDIVARYDGYDKGGNTSVAFDTENIYKWSGPTPYKAESWGYFTPEGREVPYIKRDRDLGQTFTYTGEVPKQLTAITVSTGYGTNVVRSKMYRQNISIQIFEVSGHPVLHNNGSDSTVKAFHGFPHNRISDSISPVRDDYFTGEVFTSLAVFSGAAFPGKTAFGFKDDGAEVPPDHPFLKGKYLRFVLPENNRILLQPGRRYAFLIMIDNMCSDCGFTLANNYYGTYAAGHGIRRDGDGRFPPVLAHPEKNFTDAMNAKALAAAHFPAKFTERIKIPPGTNGYPDVDTWRDLVFIIEAR